MTFLPKVTRNTLTLFASRSVVTVVNFIVGIYVMRYLGERLLGEYSTVFAFLSLFSIFTIGSGIDNVLIREVSKGGEGEIVRKKISTAIFLRLLLGLIGFLIALPVSRFLYPGTPVAFYIFLSSFSLLFSLHEYNSPFIAEYNARLELFVPQLLMTLVSLASASLKLLFVFGIRAPLVAFILLDAAVPVLISLTYLWLYRRSSERLFNLGDFSWEETKYLAGESAPMFIASLFTTLYLRIDQILISKWVGAEALGNYSVAVRISEVFNFVPVFLAASLLPVFTKMLSDETREEVYGFAFRFLNMFIFPVILFCTLFSREFIDLLFPGQFPHSPAALQVLIWSELFVFSGVIHATILLANGLQKYDVYFVGVQAVANFLLNWVLIGRLGIVGASWASVLSYGIGIVVAMFIPSVKRFTKILIRCSWTFLGVSLMVLGIGAYLPSIPKIVLGPAGVAILFFAGMRKSDLRLIVDIWSEIRSIGARTQQP